MRGAHGLRPRSPGRRFLTCVSGGTPRRRCWTRRCGALLSSSRRGGRGRRSCYRALFAESQEEEARLAGDRRSRVRTQASRSQHEAPWRVRPGTLVPPPGTCPDVCGRRFPGLATSALPGGVEPGLWRAPGLLPRGSLRGDVRRATRECSNVARTQGPLAMQTARGRHRLRSSVTAAGKGSLWLAERLTNCLRRLRETSPPVTTGIKQVAGEKRRGGRRGPEGPRGRVPGGHCHSQGDLHEFGLVA